MFNFKRKTILKFILTNWLIICLFLISTGFFIWQHSITYSWDFHASVLNAKYLFGEKNYFEWIRPPLMPFILGLMSFFGWKIAEYLFIIIVSVVFLFSSIKLSKALKINPSIFYSLSLTGHLLYFGLINGTELLSLALFELALVFLLDDNELSGLFIGLSSLARYTFLPFFIILLLHKGIKKKIKSMMLFIITLTPWFIYNLVTTENMFTSMADHYAMNILFRQYQAGELVIKQIAQFINIFLPLIVIGIIIVTHQILSKKSSQTTKNIKVPAIMMTILIYVIYVYSNTPIRYPRYLFLIILPATYFSSITISWIANIITDKRPDKKQIVTFIFIIAIFITQIAGVIYYQDNEMWEKNMLKEAKQTLIDLNISNCQIFSNDWVQINYIGLLAEPTPKKELIDSWLDKGKKFAYFYYATEPGGELSIEEIKNKPILYQNERYVLFGKQNKCVKAEPYANTYIENTKINIKQTTGKIINSDICFLMFEKQSLIERMCNLINLNGLTISENRTTLEP